LAVEASVDGVVELVDVDVSLPPGDRIADALDLPLTPRASVVISGTSGTGKTTLMRSLAQMWPYSSGTVRLPAVDGEAAMFLSQLPYAPLGPLRAVVCYPSPPDAFADNEIRRALHTVTLGHLTDRL